MKVERLLRFLMAVLSLAQLLQIGAGAGRLATFESDRRHKWQVVVFEKVKKSRIATLDRLLPKMESRKCQTVASGV